MILREERSGEAEAIRALTAAAFAPMPFADDNDPLIPGRLRKDGDLLLSLVADEDGRIVGHAAFSAATVGGVAGWVGLGPISVAPDRQRQGIGRALIADGLDRLSDRAGCVLVGNPAVYGGSGFVSGAVSWRDLSAEYVMKRVLAGPDATGEIGFAPAFDG